MAVKRWVHELLSPRDAGRLLGITSAGVIKLALRGKLPELRDSSGRRLFLRSEVETLAAKRAKKAGVTGVTPDVIAQWKRDPA